MEKRYYLRGLGKAVDACQAVLYSFSRVDFRSYFKNNFSR